MKEGKRGKNRMTCGRRVFGTTWVVRWKTKKTCEMKSQTLGTLQRRTSTLYPLADERRDS